MPRAIAFLSLVAILIAGAGITPATAHQTVATPSGAERDWITVPVEAFQRAQAQAPAHSLDTPPVDEPLDICVAYTQAMLDYVNEHLLHSLEVLASYSIDGSNRMFQEAAAPNLSFRLMPTFLVPDYTEPHDMVQIIVDLQQGAGGLALAHQKREQYGCDILQLSFYFENAPHGGMAYQMDANSLGWGFRDWAVGINAVTSIFMVHEAGHNLGAAHQPGDGNIGITDFAHAYIYQQTPYYMGTLMTGYPYVGSGYWSNTRVMHPDGFPLGDAGHNNIDALEISMPIARTWRDRTISDEAYVYLDSPDVEPGPNTISGYVMTPGAFLEVSIDGDTWVEATTTGNDWLATIEVSPYATELLVKVNSGPPVHIPIHVVLTPDAALTGSVTDAGTGQPLTGATVATNLGGFSTLTDGSGHYALPLASGDQTISVDHRLVVDPALTLVYHDEAGITVIPGITHTLDFAITPTRWHTRAFLPVIARGTP